MSIQGFEMHHTLQTFSFAQKNQNKIKITLRE